MRLRIFTEPQQGATYATLRSVAKAAEDLGFDAFFRSDHYLSMGNGSGEPGPSDAWATLAGLAVETTRIKLGTLVTSATFRYPGPLAITVAGVDEMSGGRVEFGLGTGWFAAEHQAYGIPFPPTAERFDRLAEQLEIITGLWRTPAAGKFSYQGKYYQLSDSPALPKPASKPHPPVIVGGHGHNRTPALAAKYADEFNIAFSPVDEVAAQFGRVRAACAAAGRDPDTLRYSVAQVVCCAKDENTLSRRAAAIGRDVGQLRDSGLAGAPAEIADKIGRFAQAGAQTVYFQVLDLADLDHLADLAEVLPQVLAGHGLGRRPRRVRSTSP
jgi:F420-dependent oxidoreductase-like protein